MKKNILIVEYSISAVDSIKELFSYPMFQVTVVDEGDAARKILAKDRYDLMITAAMLPKFHGFNLSYYAATNFPGLKIIIISEIYKGGDYKHQAINQYKAHDFFEKPLDIEKFKKRVYELLDLKESDLPKIQPRSATPQVVVPDTRKIPGLRTIPPENKKLSSEELFGDLLEHVKEDKTNDSKSGIDLQDKSVAATHVLKTEKENLLLTRQMPSLPQVLKKDSSSTHVLLDLELLKKEIGVTRPLKTVKPGETSATREIDLNIDELLKTNGEKKKSETQRFKKIEDDISKKFEDTLSGLGIKNKSIPLKDTQPIKVNESLARKVHEFENQERNDKNEVVGYDILGLIARGGMAEIYKAKKKGVKGFEKIIALKKILAGYNKDAKYIEMFVDEAKIAAELSHPNIVQIYDLGEKDDYYFIAMEYVPGKDLRLILQKLSESHSLLPEEISIHLILEVLKALNYAHLAKNSAGRNLDIVHRDISPPNILVSFNGDVKLTDFGVSKASIKMHQTLAGALKGKLLYMSPEQARAENDTDHRSDLYSVGIIFFELLTGEKLFMDSSDIAVLHKVQVGDIIKPRELKKDIDPQLEYIILRMLNKDKNRRYQRASDIINDINSYMARNYDRMPTPIHISHTINDLFKDEIAKEGIKIDLKPIPYKINRIQRIEMDSPTRPIPLITTPPTPPTPPTPAPSPIQTPPPPPSSSSSSSSSSSPSPSPSISLSQVPTAKLQQVIPPVEKEPLKAEKQETLVEMKEDFHPLVEIEFDDDEDPRTEVMSQSSMTTQLLQSITIPLKNITPAASAFKTEAEFNAMAELQAIKDEDARKQKKLLIIIALAIIIGAILVFFIMTGGKSTPSKNNGLNPNTTKIETGTVEKNMPPNPK
jgi:serine/threonine protein kinase/DNA-binding response OmpR family regulator